MIHSNYWNFTEEIIEIPDFMCSVSIRKYPERYYIWIRFIYDIVPTIILKVIHNEFESKRLIYDYFIMNYIFDNYIYDDEARQEEYQNTINHAESMTNYLRD